MIEVGVKQYFSDEMTNDFPKERLNSIINHQLAKAMVSAFKEKIQVKIKHEPKVGGYEYSAGLYVLSESDLEELLWLIYQIEYDEMSRSYTRKKLKEFVGKERYDAFRDRFIEYQDWESYIDDGEDDE